MRQFRFAMVALGLALVIAACETTIREPEPSGSAQPPETEAPLLDGAARDVLDAALATQAAGTLRFDADVRSADPNDQRPPATASGVLAFDEPLRFRFGSPGLGDDAVPSEVIYDGRRAFIRGRDVPFVPADSWVVIGGQSADEAAVDAFLRQYANQALVLAPPLGVTSASPADEETIDGQTTRHFVAQVDIEQARQYLPEQLLPSYDAQIATFRQIGTFPTHDLDVWIGPDGRIVRTSYEHVVNESLDETIRVTNDLTDFGAAIDLVPPAGADVIPLDEARERYLPSNAPAS